jgi:hypothetical protein
VPDVILALLRIIFLGLVYLFVWQVARAIGSHLGISVRRKRKEGEAESSSSDPKASRDRSSR